MNSLIAGFAASIALIPAAILPLCSDGAKWPTGFWGLLVIAVAGPAAYIGIELQHGWYGGLAATLWISVAASAFVFTVVCRTSEVGWRLAPLMFGYLFLLALFAISGNAAGSVGIRAYRIDGWLLTHIILSVAAYAMATVAAVAGAAVVIKQTALKRKTSWRLSRLMPPVAQADKLQVTMLSFAAVILGVDILSGMATEYAKSGTFVQFEHKTVLAGLAFAIIALLLALHTWSGVRGRNIARGFLIAYLLLTLGYPGVKFVTDVIMA